MAYVKFSRLAISILFDIANTADVRLEKTFIHGKASIAQMVERKTLNLVVVGSIPTGGASFFLFAPQLEFLRKKVPQPGVEPGTLG